MNTLIAFIIFGGVCLALLAAHSLLLWMRDRRGVYDWPIPVQRLILLAIGQSPMRAGGFPNQKAFFEWIDKADW